MNGSGKKIALGVGLALFSAGTSAVVSHFSAGDFFAGWLAAFALCVPFSLILWLCWRWSGGGKMVAAMMLAAFALRLGFGLATQNLLPIYGYPEEPQQRLGYLFDDAWRRDDEAWRITTTEETSFFEPLTRMYNNDQYGGMAVLSIWIYRYLSPDARRFSLIILLGAFFTAGGLPFFWKVLKNRWDPQLAKIAAWVYVLYPDSIVYAGAAMREPFLTGLLAAAFWALCTMRDHWKKSAVVLAGCVLLMLPFSSFVTAAAALIAIMWIWIEFLVPRSKKWLWAGCGAVLLGVLVSLVLALPSIQEFIHYDIHQSEINSGWVEKVVGEVGGQFRTIFLAVYGITQPVLPAILFYRPTTIYWKVVGIFRAAGWYAMVPFLFYALFSVFRVKDKKERKLLLVNAVFVLGWIFVSSLRAGGDQWDNPRYRVIFLPWLAFFTAWGFCFARRTKDWWLVRWILIELVFVGFFSQWYFSRYYADIIHRFPFWKTVTYITICSGIIFATGFVAPLLKKFRGKKDDS